MTSPQSHAAWQQGGALKQLEESARRAAEAEAAAEVAAATADEKLWKNRFAADANLGDTAGTAATAAADRDGQNVPAQSTFSAPSTAHEGYGEVLMPDISSLRCFHTRRWLARNLRKKKGASVTKSKISQKMLTRLKTLFVLLDRDRDSLISAEELRKGLQSVGLPQKLLKNYFVGTDGTWSTAMLSLEQFCLLFAKDTKSAAVAGGKKENLQEEMHDEVIFEALMLLSCQQLRADHVETIVKSTDNFGSQTWDSLFSLGYYLPKIDTSSAAGDGLQRLREELRAQSPEMREKERLAKEDKERAEAVADKKAQRRKDRRRKAEEEEKNGGQEGFGENGANRGRVSLHKCAPTPGLFGKSVITEGGGIDPVEELGTHVGGLRYLDERAMSTESMIRRPKKRLTKRDRNALDPTYVPQRDRPWLSSLTETDWEEPEGLFDGKSVLRLPSGAKIKLPKLRNASGRVVGQSPAPSKSEMRRRAAFEESKVRRAGITAANATTIMAAASASAQREELAASTAAPRRQVPSNKYKVIDMRNLRRLRLEKKKKERLHELAHREAQVKARRKLPRKTMALDCDKPRRQHEKEKSSRLQSFGF